MEQIILHHWSFCLLQFKTVYYIIAQRMGLIEAPGQLLTEKEWERAKEKSNKRDDSKMPCVICKEDFGTQQQVLTKLAVLHIITKTHPCNIQRFLKVKKNEIFL